MEIISIAKLLVIVHFFVLKHEKQTLSYIHTKFEGRHVNMSTGKPKKEENYTLMTPSPPPLPPPLPHIP